MCWSNINPCGLASSRSCKTCSWQPSGEQKRSTRDHPTRHGRQSGPKGCTEEPQPPTDQALGQGGHGILKRHIQLQEKPPKKQGTQQKKNARALQGNTRNTQNQSRSQQEHHNSTTTTQDAECVNRLPFVFKMRVVSLCENIRLTLSKSTQFVVRCNDHRHFH